MITKQNKTRQIHLTQHSKLRKRQWTLSKLPGLIELMFIILYKWHTSLAWLLPCLELHLPKKVEKTPNRRKSFLFLFIGVTYTGANKAVRQIFWRKYLWQQLYWKSTQIMVNYQSYYPKKQLSQSDSLENLMSPQPKLKVCEWMVFGATVVKLQ